VQPPWGFLSGLKSGGFAFSRINFGPAAYLVWSDPRYGLNIASDFIDTAAMVFDFKGAQNMAL